MVSSRLKRYWLIPSFLLLIEGGIGSYSVIKHRPFFGTHKYIVERVKPGMSYIKKAIPKIIDYYGGNQVNPKILEIAAKHPRTIRKVKELFEKDIRNTYSEISGIATLCREKKDCYIRFYEIKSENEDFVEELENARRRRDSKEMMKILKKNKEIFMSILDIDKEKYGQMMHMAEMKERTKESYLTRILAWVKTISNSLDIYSPENTADFYHKVNLEGEYIGEFHTHDDGSHAVSSDLNSSFTSRQLVFSLKRDGFTLYDIVTGAVNNEIDVKTDCKQWVSFRNYNTICKR